MQCNALACRSIERWFRVVASSSKVSTSCGSESISLGSPGGVDCFVSPHFVAPAEGKAAFVSPFWIVARSKHNANMKLSYETETLGKGTQKYEVKVPVMTNTKYLQIGDFLAVNPPERLPHQQPSKRQRCE